MATILVVDDDADIRTLIETVLEASGHDVTLAASGQEALNKLKRRPYELVILDIMMPTMSGYEVLEQIRAMPSRAATPVIVVTAKHDPSGVMREVRGGAIDHLAKPFLPEELEEAALVDGCIRVQAIWKIVLPLAVPGLIGVGTFVFIGSWNEYLLAVVLTETPRAQTLTVGLAQFFGQYVRDWNGIMALSTLASLPLVAVFVFLQRWVVQGLSSGAIK